MTKAPDDLKIYIVSKNSIGFPAERHFQPIQGGRALTTTILPGTVGDDSGDSISAFNEYYAEVSSMYWVWKNAPKSKYVGFFHYRRFLNFGAPLCPEAHWSERNFYDFSPESIERFGWSEKAIMDAIGDADVALPFREVITRPPQWDQPCSLYTHYRNAHLSRDINLAMQGMRELYPHEYAGYEETLYGQMGYFCHMYVMRWEIFDAYMTWLFSILFYVQERIDTSAEVYGPSSGQTRMLGFIAERIFNVFLEQKRREGATFVEFERLFGKLPAASNVKLQQRRKESSREVMTRFQNGITFSLPRLKIDLYQPD
ncbi:DUF4422 domain-containing protein [Rhodovarius lipocyclicus]|uniref:DUF4422 domain-containing protein n=1 Tax=Rhodovarius lipocyclicus TaxID=268410 RepID=UPI001359DE2C|nr:DUF4422 domain-containing protein [Rhodovarius lipocyclicus]